MQPFGSQLPNVLGHVVKKTPKAGSAMNKQLSPVIEAKIRDAVRQQLTGFKPLPVGVRPGEFPNKK